uniref:DUF2335 domain-containing protein n=1 Tax=Rhabditophanes sp. KR3021 TaxID=114890 RepID=A0AC35TZG3_9BILA
MDRLYCANDKEALERLLSDVMNKDEFLKEEHKSFLDIKQFVKTLPADFAKYKLIELFRPVPIDESIKHSESFKKLTAKLRIREENNKYRDMVKSLDPTQNFGKENLMKDFGKDMKEVNRQSIAIFNTLITVAGAFTFGYYGITFMYPGLNLSFETKIIVGLVLATIVFIADLYFIIKSMDPQDPTKVEQNTKKKIIVKRPKIDIVPSGQEKESETVISASKPKKTEGKKVKSSKESKKTK